VHCLDCAAHPKQNASNAKPINTFMWRLIRTPPVFLIND
jgi:hypothetical protein